eukprot:scaffold13351_cov17-Prasinocladus_malaysianus.AAC.1
MHRQQPAAHQVHSLAVMHVCISSTHGRVVQGKEMVEQYIGQTRNNILTPMRMMAILTLRQQYSK